MAEAVYGRDFELLFGGAKALVDVTPSVGSFSLSGSLTTERPTDDHHQPPSGHTSALAAAPTAAPSDSFPA